MKALVLVVLAFALTVTGRAAASECLGGWSVSVLDKTTRETKVWCPEDKEFEFRIPWWKEAVCSLAEVKVTTDKPNAPSHTRWLSCTVRGVMVADVVAWYPVSSQSNLASFTVADAKNGREFFVSADYTTR
jgi:hypothetical protein